MKKAIFIVLLGLISGPDVFSQETDTASLYLDSGRVAMKKREYRLAVFYFEKAKKADTARADACFQLALAYVSIKDTLKAFSNFNRTVEMNPSHYIAYKERGKYKASLLDYRGSIEDFSKAIQIKKDYSEAWFNRGISKHKLKLYSDAAADFSKVISLNPKDAEAWYWRGDAKLRYGDKTGGCSDLGKAGELGYTKAYKLIKKSCGT